MRGDFIKSGAVGLIFFCFALNAAARQQSAAAPKTAGEALAKYEQLLQASPDPEKKFVLTLKAAETALAADEKVKARSYANDVIAQAAAMRDNWNYGNAISIGNLILGQLALDSGDVGEAKRYLLEAGKTPGSPQLNSFGPSMELAKALLEKGEREAVVQYMDLCAKFWSDRLGKLGEWKSAISEGKVPNFGPYINSFRNYWRFEKWEKLSS